MPEQHVDGIPFRLKESYIVRLYHLDPDSKKYELVHERLEHLPDMDHVYVLGLHAEGLSDHMLDVKFNEDGTLTSVDLTGTELKGDEVLAQLGTQVKEAGQAIADFEKTRIQKEADDIAAREAAELALRTNLGSKLERERTALAALQDAQKAMQTLEEFRKNPEKAALIPDQERVVIAAVKKANDMHELAGLPKPFP